MQNVEYKAELREPRLARAGLLAAGCRFVARMRQVDTYFRVASGRFKRREIEVLELAPEVEREDVAPRATEWILYERPDAAAARVSNYQIYSEEQARDRFGDLRLPELVAVTKERELLLYEKLVRVHLDEVDRLGSFLEFEALVTETQDRSLAAERVERLREAVRPWLGEAIGGSYADLMLAEQER